MADGVKALITAIRKLDIEQPDIFKSTLHSNTLYFNNNGSEGINCDIGGNGVDTAIPWEHGYKILKEIRKVTLFMACFIIIYEKRHQLITLV